ncbi:hypothetical protein ACFLTT_00205 [Chloroflexota bacterium]
MKFKMWYWILLVLVCVMVVGSSLFLISPWKDRAEYSYDEVTAYVKNDLLKYEGVIACPNFTGYYAGEGKWSGTCQVTSRYSVTIQAPSYSTKSLLGKYSTPPDQSEYPKTLIRMNEETSIWNFYEKTLTTEVIELKEE